MSHICRYIKYFKLNYYLTMRKVNVTEHMFCSNTHTPTHLHSLTHTHTHSFKQQHSYSCTYIYEDFLRPFKKLYNKSKDIYFKCFILKKEIPFQII